MPPGLPIPMWWHDAVVNDRDAAEHGSPLAENILTLNASIFSACQKSFDQHSEALDGSQQGWHLLLSLIGRWHLAIARDATVRSGFGFGPELDRTGPRFGLGPGPVRPFALGSGSGFGMGWVFCEPGPNWSEPRTRKLCLRASL